jgi:hypothetical protein
VLQLWQGAEHLRRPQWLGHGGSNEGRQWRATAAGPRDVPRTTVAGHCTDAAACAAAVRAIRQTQRLQSCLLLPL